MITRFVTSCLMISLVWFAACGKATISERDARLAQIRNQAENKRRELQPIVGNYSGVFQQASGQTQNVTLKIEIKDIPTPVEGFVDPVMTPVLTGFLKLILGESEGAEYLGFGISKADYDPKQKTLNLVASNDSYKDLILAFRADKQSLEGSWTAPAIAASGDAKLSKTATVLPSQELRGDYSGVLTREAQGAYQFSQLTLNTSLIPPQGLKVTAVWRIIFGDWKSSEYLTYTFDDVAFNPLTGQLVLKSDKSDASFVGTLSQGKLQGEWFSNYTGKLGVATFQKSTSAPSTPEGLLFEALRGTYQGSLKNTNPQSNLPEKLQVSFVTSQDLSQPSGVKITGTLRFYLGSFDSTEYIEVPLDNIQYNFYTRSLVAKSTGEIKLTLKAEVFPKKVKGSLSSDALGEVALVEVDKP